MKLPLSTSLFPQPLKGMVLMGCAAWLVGAPAASAGEGEITAVSSQVSSDYHREKLSDGSFKPETYTFGEGGHKGGPMHDDSVDKMTFLDVAKIISVPLSERNYVPEADRDPDKTKLLIMVYWGTTGGTEGASDSVSYQNLQATQGAGKPPPPPPPTGGAAPLAGPDLSAEMKASRDATVGGALAAISAENRQRDQADMQNAALLGYDSELAASSGLELTAFRNKREDLIAEIEESRYFVVLMAYDFDVLWKHKKHKLLWVTRMSLRERGTNFSKTLPAMVKYASQYFGEDSGGLLRKPLPEGHVEVGETRSLGVVPEK